MAAISNAGKEQPVISTAASTGHIEAIVPVNIAHIKAIVAANIAHIKATTIAGIALVTDRIAITFYLYYKNLNYFAT